MTDIRVEKIDELGKQFNTQIVEELSNIEPFFFFPNIGNLGDAIIAESEYQLLENNFKYETYCTNNLPEAEEFNLVYGGGGLFVKNWDYTKVLDIFKKKNLKKAIIFPSSFYECDDVLEILDERFVVFCREMKSYKYCTEKNSKAKFYIADDMAFSLNLNPLKNRASEDPSKIKNKVFGSNIELLNFVTYPVYRKIYEKILIGLNTKTEVIQDEIRLGYFLRNDSEKKITDSTVNFFDLSNMGGGYWTDTGLVHLISEIFVSAIDTVDVVITDRLHIGITGALLKKKVFLFDNSYGKVSGVYEKSMQSMSNVKLLSNFEELSRELNNITLNDKSANLEFLNKKIPSAPAFVIDYLLRDTTDSLNSSKITKTLWNIE